MHAVAGYTITILPRFNLVCLRLYIAAKINWTIPCCTAIHEVSYWVAFARVAPPVGPVRERYRVCLLVWSLGVCLGKYHPCFTPPVGCTLNIPRLGLFFQNSKLSQQRRARWWEAQILFLLATSWFTFVTFDRTASLFPVLRSTVPALSSLLPANFFWGRWANCCAMSTTDAVEIINFLPSIPFTSHHASHDSCVPRDCHRLVRRLGPWACFKLRTASIPLFELVTELQVFGML